MMMHTFENDGPILQRTNYFDSPDAKKGEFYLTTNAGCLRLLVPDSQKMLLPNMRCKKVYVSFLKSPDRIEIMFDDESANPFRLVLAVQQCDVAVEAGLYTCSVYVREGEKRQHACEVKAGRGAPRGSKNASKGGRDSQFQIRCAMSDKESWQAAAKRQGVSAADWATKILNEAARDQ